MLNLTRRIGDSIIIGGDITVTVKEIRGNQVTIGIDADKSVSVDRLEIHLKKLQERGNNESFENRGNK